MRKKYSLQNHRRIKHSMQAFANRAADDFGITQREVLERTGLRINVENAPRTFDDGSHINENGELVGSDGRVLFQRVGRNGATHIAICRINWPGYNQIRIDRVMKQNRRYGGFIIVVVF